MDIKNNFEKAKTSYRKNAIVQKESAFNLVEYLIKTTKRSSFDNVLEIGCGTGFLTDCIEDKIKYKKLILNDLTENFTNHTPNLFLKGDILKIEIPKNLDLILSNAVFQWVEDYSLLFSKLKASMNDGGILCFTTFGEKNFIQIKEITGIGLNYPNLTEILEDKGFKILFFEEELKTLYFNNPKELLQHIKYTGAKASDKIWTKKDVKNFEEKYFENFKDNNGFELTYHPHYYILGLK